MFYSSGSKRNSKWIQLSVISFLILLTLGVYFKIFQAQFVYDDFAFIVNNKAVQTLGPFSKFFVRPDIFTGDKGGAQNWRPVASLAFALEYFSFGANPKGFHAVSIFLHLLNLALVYLLIQRLTGRSWFSGIVAGVWALHPVNTEAVSWVSNQSSLIFLGFLILSVLSLLNFFRAYKKTWLWISNVLFAFSLLTKETALGGIFIFPLLFYLNFKNNSGSQTLKKTTYYSLLFLLIGTGYFLSRLKILSALGDHALRGTFIQNLLLAPTVFWKYLNLAVFPVNLLLEYSNFPLPHSLFDPRVIFGLISFFGLLILFIVGLRKSWPNFNIGILWFFALLTPILQIIPFSDIVGERFLYGPLVGFCFAFALGVENSFAFIRRKFNFNITELVKASAIFVFLWFSILTFSRNNAWLNSENLWLSVLKIDSRNEKALTNISAYYFQTGQGEKVLEYSKKLIEINPESQVGHLHLSIGYAMTAKFDKAEQELKALIQKDPNYKIAWVNLAAVYDDIGRWGDALKILNKLTETYPDDDHIKKGISMLEAKIKTLPAGGANNAFGGQTINFSNIGLNPQVEGDVIMSGVMGRAILAPINKPFPAMIEIYKTGESSPIISTIANDNGEFQTPLRPGSYRLKPVENDASRPFKIKNEYNFVVKDRQWISIIIKYE